ncbi:diguanylate cyclase [Nodosilinea nodulosa]|uniref:diguanylate cyclase n=1 Tax=Nodosilinea nodulosa TaxID=416001 RepID=UPI0018C26524|nr:diguanylate cyclase [Nodosilinea nodulosa]
MILVAIIAYIAGFISFYIYHRKVVDVLTTCPAYGVGTRQRLELLWARLRHGRYSVIFFDLDHIHQLNDELGYEAVDDRIRSALACFRSSRGSNSLFRWYSGDEIVVVCPTTDVEGAAVRLLQVIFDHELSATISVAPAQFDLKASVSIAAGRVQAAKAAGIRGQIV